MSASGLDVELADRLFFSGEAGAAAAEAVWDARGGELEQIAADESRTPLERLLAAEVRWRCAGVTGPGEVYARALTIPSADLPANLWGFLDYDDDDGPLGERLLATGSDAVPELRRLLDDDTPLTYAGSRDAMLGNSFGYRVKDAARYFLAKLEDRG